MVTDNEQIPGRSKLLLFVNQCVYINLSQVRKQLIRFWKGPETNYFGAGALTENIYAKFAVSEVLKSAYKKLHITPQYLSLYQK